MWIFNLHQLARPIMTNPWLEKTVYPNHPASWFTGPDLKSFFTSTHRLIHKRIMVLWPWSIRFWGAGTVISFSHDPCFKLGFPICFEIGDANQFASHHFHKSIFFRYLRVLDLHTHSSIWKGSTYAVSCPSTGGATPTVGAASWGDVVGDPLSNAKANPTAPVAMRMALAARLNSKPETRIKKSRGHFVDF